MRRRLQFLLGALVVAGSAPALAAAPAGGEVVVIPVHDEIATPELYIIRQGLKQAMAEGAAGVIFDMKTPGGALDSTLAIIEAIEHYHGRTLAYVDNEAMSAGSFICAATEQIWFAPDGIIGAAAPVTETGGDVDSTMKEKLVSYLKARIRSITEGKGYRGQVISAMIDDDSELKIDGQVIKEKGSLLSLTAQEAMKTYGHPPQPLLGAGIAPSLESLIAGQFGPDVKVQRLNVTWSERLAVLLNGLSPVLLGLGLLALFIEFKTPGFNAFGAIGIALLALVFIGSHLAGLSGHEPLLLFLVGAVLVLLELLFFHSAGFLGVVGVALMAFSVVWSMADLWPGEPITTAWDSQAFTGPLLNLGLGIAIAAALATALLRFLPRGWVWDRLVIGAQVGGRAQSAGVAPEAQVMLAELVGRSARAATTLRPAGQVEIDGRRYEATVEVGTVEAGASVRVLGRSDFGLIVQRE